MNTATLVDRATLVDGEDQPRDLFMAASALPARKGAPDLPAEAAASGELARVLATDPSLAFSCALDVARNLCHAGSSGLSSLRSTGAADMTVRWEAVRGALASHEGIDTPRDSSPCGLSLNAGMTILVSQPARAFAWLRSTRPSITEELIVPLRDETGRALGTLWIAHHDRTSHFSSDDVRIVEQLAQQLTLALMLQKQARDREHALTLLQSHQVALQTLLTHELNRERNLRKRAEAAEIEARRALVFNDAMIREVNHRTKNTLQSASALLRLQARATSSPAVRRALLDSCDRLQLLAEVHTLLCRDSGDTSSVLMTSLLQKMCDALRQSFGDICPGVILQLESDPISLPVEDAISVALFANEAVTNAYKHAFPSRSAGAITVRLHRTHEHVVALSIVDDGVGTQLPDTEAGMGLKLMRTLAAQLHGALSLGERTHATGTEIALTIDLAANRRVTQ